MNEMKKSGISGSGKTTRSWRTFCVLKLMVFVLVDLALLFGAVPELISRNTINGTVAAVAVTIFVFLAAWTARRSLKEGWHALLSFIREEPDENTEDDSSLK